MLKLFHKKLPEFVLWIHLWIIIASDFYVPWIGCKVTSNTELKGSLCYAIINDDWLSLTDLTF